MTGRLHRCRRCIGQVVLSAAGVALCAGCEGFTLPGGGENPPAPVFNNTTDPTNGGATFVLSGACSACHPDIAAEQRLHPHAHILNRLADGPPSFPPEASNAGVPNPPDAQSWADVSWVIGGYVKKALFVDLSGYILVTGVSGVPTQWNFAFPPSGNGAGLVSFEPDRATPQPYDYTCFRCHTTDPQPLDPSNPHFQDNRPGMAGSFAEPGVMCEACHGPGSNHVPGPTARNIFVGTPASNCGRCHARSDDPSVILASGGFIQNYQQWPELLASGGHKDFDCTVCHDPHVSVTYAAGIRNCCTACHTDMTLGIHRGVVFVRGDYVEPVACESCHLPYATLSGSVGLPAALSPLARVGDTRTHIFRISTVNTDYTGFFTPDGTQVAKDSSGRAAVTVDFVCLRCHNGVGNAFALNIFGASGLARVVHVDLPE